MQVLITMGSPVEPRHQAVQSGQPERSTEEPAPGALTEFDTESVIATRRIRIDTEASRGEPKMSLGWGYVALLAAFLLGVCAALIAMLVWR